MTDQEVLGRQLATLAERREPPALPPLERIQSAARHQDRVARLRRASVGVAAVIALGMVLVNVVDARRGITVLAGQPVGPDIPPATSGVYRAVATGTDWMVWLASDQSGSSRGCVSIQRRGTAPPDRLPNNFRASGAPNTLCAPPGSGVGYLLRQPASGTDPLGFGFAPATTDHLVLSFERRGPIWQRLLTSDKTVRAPTYGHELGLPVVAWIGPDPKGYSLTRLRAVTASGEVVAELTF